MVWFVPSYQGRMRLCTKNEVFPEGFFQQMWPNPQETADLVTFAEKILNGKLYFLYSDVRSMIISFCILLSGIIHLTSLLFGSFLIEPSWWTKHKGTVYEEYVSASSKVISWLTLMDNDSNFPMLLFVSISFILLSFLRAFFFSTDLNKSTYFF